MRIFDKFLSYKFGREDLFLALKGCALRSKSVWLISVPTVRYFSSWVDELLHLQKNIINSNICLKISFQNHRKIPWLMIDPCWSPFFPPCPTGNPNAASEVQGWHSHLAAAPGPRVTYPYNSLYTNSVITIYYVMSLETSRNIQKLYPHGIHHVANIAWRSEVKLWDLRKPLNIQTPGTQKSPGTAQR